AAGMSGGIAYVLDEDGTFASRCNLAMVELEPLPEEEEASARIYHQTHDLGSHGRVDVMGDMTQHDLERLNLLITRQARFTGSPIPARVPAAWEKNTARCAERCGGWSSGGRAARGRVRRSWKRGSSPPRLSANGKDPRLREIRARGPPLRAGRGAHQALARIRAPAAGGGKQETS